MEDLQAVRFHAPHLSVEIVRGDQGEDQGEQIDEESAVDQGFDGIGSDDFRIQGYASELYRQQDSHQDQGYGRTSRKRCDQFGRRVDRSRQRGAASRSASRYPEASSPIRP